MSPVARTILFWVIMIALADVLWQMSSRRGSVSSPSEAMNYSDFMSQVDANNVASARLLESAAAAVVQGQLRQPAQHFKVTIPKEVIPELTERLRKQGATLEVAEVANDDKISLLIRFSPILIIVGIWIFMMRRKGNRPGPSSQAGPASGALG
jgi:ATP-dependent Zn protease